MEQDYLFSTELDVRWGDLDAFNHVNNAAFLDYIQEARLRWMLTMPRGWYSDEIHPVVVNATNNYRAPVTWPARLRIDLGLGRTGARSLTIAHRIVDAANPDTVHADGHVVLVWISRQTGQALPVPDVVTGNLGA